MLKRAAKRPIVYDPENPPLSSKDFVGFVRASEILQGKTMEEYGIAEFHRDLSELSRKRQLGLVPPIFQVDEESDARYEYLDDVIFPPEYKHLDPRKHPQGDKKN